MLVFLVNIFVGTRHHKYVGINENFDYTVSLLTKKPNKSVGFRASTQPTN